MSFDELNTIHHALRREQYWQLLAFLLLMGLGCFLSYHFFSDNIILTIIGLALIILAVKNGHQLLQNWNVDDHRLIRLIYFQPEQIVWVYPMIIDRRPFGLQFSKNITLYFKLSDGDEFTVSIPGYKLHALLIALHEMLPHATFGHSKDKEQWYMADPEMLRR